MSKQLENAVETMRVYAGSVGRVSLRDEQRLYARAFKAVEKIAKKHGMSSENVWSQVEQEARRRGLKLATPGKDI